MGWVRTLDHLLTTQTEPRGFIKLLVQNKVVYMELSLHLSFHLNRNLEGYTMGTTTGFCITTKEDLAPWPYHRILR
jgi:hypothetical protein